MKNESDHNILESKIKTFDLDLMKVEELLRGHCTQLKNLQATLTYLETVMKSVLITQSIYEDRLRLLELNLNRGKTNAN